MIASLHPETLLEKTPVRFFSQDFCDIFENTFLVKLLLVTAFKISLSRKYLAVLTQLGFY